MLHVNSAADFSGFLEFGTWFGHMTVDAVQSVEGDEIEAQGHDKKQDPLRVKQTISHAHTVV